MTTLTLPIEGMTCGGCASSVQKALTRVPGVRSVTVEHHQDRAIVEVDDSTPRQSLKDAVEDAGFDVPAAFTA